MTNWNTYLQDMNATVGWQQYVVPAWKSFTEYTLKHLINRNGRLRNDFIIANDDRGYGVLASWGAVPPAVNEYYELYMNSLVDWEKFADPEHGGLRDWDRALDARNNLEQHVDPEIGEFFKGLSVSPATIIHVCSIEAAFRDANLDITSVNGAVQWGAGIGNHSRVMRLMGLKTEYIIDLPVATVVQYEFLNAAFPGEVVLVDGYHEPEEGKINIVPLPFLDKVPDQDLFIALHSLNESTVAAQDMVAKDKKWFGADTCIVAWTDHLTDRDGTPFGDGIPHWAEIVEGIDMAQCGLGYWVFHP